MAWRVLLRVVRLLFEIALAWMLLHKSDRLRVAQISNDRRIEFTRNRFAFYAWPPIIVLLIWEAVGELIHSQGKPFELLKAALLGWFALALLISFPGTIVVNNDGIEEVYWFWKHKRIQWKDIVEINTGGKSCTVTITSADGTKIVHSSQLADRARLLLELKQHCGENLPSDFPQEVKN